MDPGERLSSMMAPSVAAWRQGGALALGSGGSNRIRTAVTQVLANVALRALPLQDAVSAPRVHVERGMLDFEDIVVEPLFSQEDRAALLEAFPEHRAWAEPSLYFGGRACRRLHAGRGHAAAGDSRREGVGVVL